MLKVGLIGYGYWGPNLYRNFRADPDFRVVAIADERPDKRALIERTLPDVRAVDSGEALIDMGLDVVVIATRLSTHYALARRALEAGSHVMVEKPMTASTAEAEALVALARERGLTLMVDHTFLFTGAVEAIKGLIDRGDLGEVSYYDSMRVNLGLFQPDTNVLWDLAPHDFSIMDHLLEEEPIRIEASGFCHVNDGLPDIVYLTMHFASNRVAHFNLSWMSPVKVRRVGIGGSNRMLVWDDLNREEKIKIYDAGIQLQPEGRREVVIPDYRIGDIYSPRVENTEALAKVVRHMSQVIRGDAAPIMSGEHGLRNVRMLEIAQSALDASLADLRAARATPAAGA